MLKISIVVETIDSYHAKKSVRSTPSNSWDTAIWNFAVCNRTEVQLLDFEVQLVQLTGLRGPVSPVKLQSAQLTKNIAKLLIESVCAQKMEYETDILHSGSYSCVRHVSWTKICFDNFKSVYRSKYCGRFKFLSERSITSINFKCFQIEIQRASGFETTPDS